MTLHEPATAAGLDRAEGFLDLNRPDEALRVLAPLLASDPNDADLHRLAGRALFLQNRFPESRSELERAAVLEPENLAIVTLLAHARSACGDAKGAVAAARETVRVFPHAAGAHAVLSEMLVRSGSSGAEALHAAERAIELAPATTTGHFALGRVHLARQHVRRARKAFEDVLRIDPANQAAQHNLAVVRMQSLQPFGAARDFARLAGGPDGGAAVRAAVSSITMALRLTALALSLVAIVLASLAGAHDVPAAARWAVAVPSLLLVGGVVGIGLARLGPHRTPVLREFVRRPLLLVAALVLVAGTLMLVLAAAVADASVATYELCRVIFIAALVLAAVGRGRMHRET